MVPTYYVEDYDGERNKDAVETVVLAPVTEYPEDGETTAKVVEPAKPKRAAKKTSKASTK
jgi:hypothetical protein